MSISVEKKKKDKKRSKKQAEVATKI